MVGAVRLMSGDRLEVAAMILASSAQEVLLWKRAKKPKEHS